MWLLGKKEVHNILLNGQYGVLATCNKNLQPYGVPLVYVVEDNYLYIHTGTGGQINENLDENDLITFTIVADEAPIFDGRVTLKYKSVIVKGKAILVDDVDEKFSIMQKVVKKYLSTHQDFFDTAAQVAFKDVVMHKILLDDVSGHQNK